MLQLVGLTEKDRVFEGLSREQLTREVYGNRDAPRGSGGGSPFGQMGGGGGGGRGRGGFGR